MHGLDNGGCRSIHVVQRAEKVEGMHESEQQNHGWGVEGFDSFLCGRDW